MEYFRMIMKLWQKVVDSEEKLSVKTAHLLGR